MTDDIDTLAAELREQLPDTLSPDLLRHIARVVLAPTAAEVEAMQDLLRSAQVAAHMTPNRLV